MVLHHEHELCTQNALVLWQTAVALFLHTCKVSCELCLLTCSLDLRLSPQGFDDQPGVEPQRLLSAQRRHHLIQPITVQLDDLQVETGSQGLQFPQSPLPPMPLPFNTEANSPPALSSSSLGSVPIAQPVFYGTEACLHKRKTKNLKNLRQKLKNRLYI